MDESVGCFVGCHMTVQKPILDLFYFFSLNRRDPSPTLPGNGKVE